jgi:anti-anti-sigma factor
MLTITVKDWEDEVILQCQGRIVSGEETAILCAAMAQQGRNVALDLAEVTALDAAGIGVLVSLQAAGIYIRLMNPTEYVREILKVTGLDSVFEIRSSEDAEGRMNKAAATV